jgi:alkylation response protein AidB-like acyl-CoA dehydrogenase
MRLELSPEHASFRQSAEQFAREAVAPRAAAIDETGEFPLDIFREAAARGFLGIALPSTYGGLGLDYLSYALAIEAVGGASATVAAAMVVQQSLVAEVLLHAGTREQRERWLRTLIAGKAIGAFALSEPDAGTDAANLQTTAERSGERYRIRGTKVWVANAEAAKVALVLACTTPGRRDAGVTAFLVPLDVSGIRRVAHADSLGVRGLGCMDLAFDVEVGSDAVIGEVDGGMRLATWALHGARIAIAAQALGIGEAALAQAMAHAKRRRTFGQPIAKHQAIQFMLADRATDLAAARLLTWKGAVERAAGRDAAVEASMATLAAAEAAHRAADQSMQILASAGYRRGSVVERLFRDVRAVEIYQGTSEVQRMIIARSILGLQGTSTHTT